MAKSCEFKTAEASTKAWLRTNEMIDKNLNIREGMLGAFREQNTKWSKKAFQKYNGAGIKPYDRLFTEEQNGKIAVPNKEAFYRIDAFNKKLYKENAAYVTEMRPSKEFSSEFVDDLYNLNLTPDVIKYLYSENGSRHNLNDYGFLLNRLVNTLRSQGRTNKEVLDDIKCL